MKTIIRFDAQSGFDEMLSKPHPKKSIIVFKRENFIFLILAVKDLFCFDFVLLRFHHKAVKSQFFLMVLSLYLGSGVVNNYILFNSKVKNAMAQYSPRYLVPI